MNQKIDIGIPIDLQKLLETRLLIQAGSGGGKSYIIRKLIETIGSRVQQVIIDPEGEFYTIREKLDFVHVGKGGDIPINLRYAEMLAHKLLETGLSAVIDLYELKAHERVLFVKRFLDAFTNAPKELWHPCFIHIDEAHVFAPESSKSEALQAVIDICTRGRKRGFAAVLATQRLSKLHKDAAAECLNKMIGRTGLDIDRKRSGEELGMVRKEDVINLRNLVPGEFFAFGPAIANEVTKFKVLPVATTHLQSGKRITASTPVPDAIKKILSKLSDIPEEAEKELVTTQQLRAEVTRLRTELTKAVKSTPANPKAVELAVQAAKQDLKKQYEASAKDQSANIQRLEKECARLIDSLKKIKAIAAGHESGEAKTETVRQIKTTNIQPIQVAKVQTNPRTTAQEFNGNIGTGEMKILIACGQFENGLERNQFTVLTGYKRSSRDAYIQRLSGKGLVEIRGGKVFATEQGIEALGTDYSPLPTGTELQEYWLGILPEGEKKILRILIDAYPEAVNREFLSEKTGYMRSSRDAYIQRLIPKEIVSIVGRGEVIASENLFD